VTEIRKLFADEQPAGPVEDGVNPSFIEMARAVAAIAATRTLLLIAVLTGAGIWGYTVVVDPTRDRLLAAIAFSIVFVLPQTLLYFRRG
jgi:hypothetical protein